ncbi:uncharacterized protein DUF1524 [Marinobacter pelagius]|uniref:Uncharacterized protein DUF1524 n=1 Tax=Marinobacter pelagius TaxID=379482 RepID=A0A366GKY0_9GAMM|nr:HNH endonuclease family protein [Marinobacter pelagius]RBP27925.1 uncharacterized protein DUF1524 [Marinobacter pelagius]
MRYFQWLVLALSWVIGIPPVAAETVKKTSSGICHPPASAYYERTQNFRAFDSTEACLASGGRLPKQLAKAQATPSHKRSPERYKRSAFGHGWDDADGDCQDSRAKALIATSTTTVRFASGDRCRVTTGRWISPFTGNVIQNSGEIDIDHVVPLAWSGAHGADDWRDEKRERFANDPVNLWPVEAGLNRSTITIKIIPNGRMSE